MLDQTSSQPLYRQLSALLLQRIESGAWQPQQKIPTEAQLCQQFGVSRMTVRLALEELRNKGLLNRRPGVGTFIQLPKIEQKLTSFYSFGDTMEHRGLRPAGQVLGLEVVPCPADAAHNLEVEPDTPVFHLLRVRSLDGVPFAYENSYILHSLCPQLTAQQIETAGLYQSIFALCGLRPNKASETIEAVFTGKAAAGALAVPHNQPALHIQRVSRADALAVEYCSSIVRGDRLRYTVQLA